MLAPDAFEPKGRFLRGADKQHVGDEGPFARSLALVGDNPFGKEYVVTQRLQCALGPEVLTGPDGKPFGLR